MTDFVKVAQGPAASSTPPCPSLRSMTFTLLAVASEVKERGMSQRSHPCHAECPFGSWEYVWHLKSHMRGIGFERSLWQPSSLPVSMTG